MLGEREAGIDPAGWSFRMHESREALAMEPETNLMLQQELKTST